MKYLMHVHTRIIDTEDNWRLDYENADLPEWFGFECAEDMEAAIDEDCAWDAMLIEVIKDNAGWLEKKTGNRRTYNQ